MAELEDKGTGTAVADPVTKDLPPSGEASPEEKPKVTDGEQEKPVQPVKPEAKPQRTYSQDEYSAMQSALAKQAAKDRLERRLAEDALKSRLALSPEDPPTKEDIALAQVRARHDAEYAAADHQTRQQQALLESANTMVSEMEAVGLDPNSPEVTNTVGKLWQSGDYAGAHKMAGKLIAKAEIKAEAEAKIKAEEAKALDGNRKKKVEDAGGLTIGNTRNMGTSHIPTDKAALGKFIRDLSPEEYVKLKPDIERVKASSNFK
jgi:hypothetical protein